MTIRMSYPSIMCYLECIYAVLDRTRFPRSASLQTHFLTKDCPEEDSGIEMLGDEEEEVLIFIFIGALK